jgi:hypothetical protein
MHAPPGQLLMYVGGVVLLRNFPFEALNASSATGIPNIVRCIV